MADGTQLNLGTGGDLILTEDAGNAAGKIPVSKIRVGAQDVDGGDVTIDNPFPVQLSDPAGGDHPNHTNHLAITDNQQNPAIAEAAVRDRTLIAAIDDLKASLQPLIDQTTVGEVGVRAWIANNVAVDAFNREVGVGAALTGSTFKSATDAPFVNAGISPTGKVRLLAVDENGELFLASDGPTGVGKVPAVAALVGGTDGRSFFPLGMNPTGSIEIDNRDVVDRLDLVIAKMDQLLLTLYNALGSSPDVPNTNI